MVYNNSFCNSSWDKGFCLQAKPSSITTTSTQGLDVKSGEAFKKQFKELEQFTEEREKAKKTQKPVEKQKPEANNSIKNKNMLLKKFDENYNFDGA